MKPSCCYKLMEDEHFKSVIQEVRIEIREARDDVVGLVEDRTGACETCAESIVNTIMAEIAIVLELRHQDVEIDKAKEAWRVIRTSLVQFMKDANDES